MLFGELMITFFLWVVWVGVVGDEREKGEKGVVQDCEDFTEEGKGAWEGIELQAG